MQINGEINGSAETKADEQLQSESCKDLQDKLEQTKKDAWNFADNVEYQIEELKKLFSTIKKQIEQILSVTKAYEADVLCVYCSPYNCCYYLGVYVVWDPHDRNCSGINCGDSRIQRCRLE